MIIGQSTKLVDEERACAVTELVVARTAKTLRRMLEDNMVGDLL